MNRFVYPSIVTVPEDTARILEALRRLPTGVPASTHFGKGNSADLFIQCLRSDLLWAVTPQKQFRDLAGRREPGTEPVTAQGQSD